MDIPQTISSADDEGISRTIIAIVGTLTGVSALFVAARIFVRVKILKNIGLDDYLTLLAMSCAMANLALTTAAADSGSGRHWSTLTMEEQQNTVKFTMAAFCPGILSFAIPKLAVVALLTKLLEPSRVHMIFLWVSAGVTTMVLFGCVIILYAQCTPSRSQWDFSITDKTCWSPWVLVDYAIFAGALSGAVDLYLAVYPALILFKLQMNLRKKVALSGALGIGSVACVVAVYKCTQIPGLASNDFSYTTANLVIWTCVEGSTIIIASCIPIMQPLVRFVFNRNAFSSHPRGGASYTSNTQKRTHDSGIAMSSDLGKSSKNRSRAKIGVSYPTEIDSQDSILREEEGQEADHGVQSYKRQSHVQGKITRVDEITVSTSLERDEPNKGNAW